MFRKHLYLLALSTFTSGNEIRKDGEKIEPEAPVQVTIAYDQPVELKEGGELAVVHFADAGTEVIHDIEINDDGSEIAYQQSSFSVAGTVVSYPELANGGENLYAIVVEHEGEYYAVLDDGSLLKIENYTKDQGVLHKLSLEYPLMWQYGIEDGKPYLRHATEATSIRTDGTSLPKTWLYRYISNSNPDNSGISEWDSQRYDNDGKSYIYYDQSTNTICDYGNHDNHLGVRNVNGKLYIAGHYWTSPAAKVYLVKEDNVPWANAGNHTVTHIDISVKGQSNLRVPLEYGDYYYYEGDYDDEGVFHKTSDEKHILSVDDEHPVTLTISKTVGVTVQDIKNAVLRTFTIDENGNQHDVQDAFLITGYSGNGSTNISTPQVRIEGSFKVCDTDSMDESYRQYNIWWNPEEGEEAVYDPWIKDQSEQWHNGFVYKGNYYGALKDDDYHKALREERLKHILYYSLETVKDVDFTLSYGEGKYPLYEDDSDTPMSLTAKVKLATTFNYWDEANECPPCVLMNPNWTRVCFQKHKSKKKLKKYAVSLLKPKGKQVVDVEYNL